MRKDPTEFRKRFAAWKNGKQPYENGLPKYEDGTPTRVGDYNVYPSAIGASELNVTTPEVVVTGKDRRPLYLRYAAERSTYDPNVIRNFTDWLPIVGDIGTGIDIKNAIQNKNYLLAGILGSMMVLPAAVGKILKPVTKYGRILSKTEKDTYVDALNSIYKDMEKDVLRFYDDKLPGIYEVDDIASKVHTKAGSLEYYPSLEEVLNFPMQRPSGKNTLRKDVTDYILDKKGFPATYGNRDLLLEGQGFEKLTPWQIKIGERYNPLQFDVKRIEKSSIEAALPYISDAIPELSTWLALKIIDKYPWITKRLIDDKSVLKSGKPFIDKIPSEWDGVTNIIDQMYPARVKANIKYGISKLDRAKKGELMRQYGLFKLKNPSTQTNYTTSDGATIMIDPDSKTSAAYFDPNTALKKAQDDFDRIFPGESWALVDDGALSPDSYTLLEALTRRHAKSGSIHIPIKPDGTVSMLKLNNMNKYRTIEHVKKAVSNLRKTTGIDLPDPYEIDGRVIAPNFYWTKNL